MLLEYCIAHNHSVQPYKYLGTEILRCPHCNGQVHICGNYTMQLLDMPSYPDTRQAAEMGYHRYRCLSCGPVYTGNPLYGRDGQEKRLEGLIAHALYPISTGKLEGFNNKIKVLKELAMAAGMRTISFY